MFNIKSLFWKFFWLIKRKYFQVMYLIILPAGLPLPCQAAWIKKFNWFCFNGFFPALAEQCSFVWALSTSGERF